MGDGKAVAVLTTIGGALVVIGSFLPWISVSSGFGGLSKNGLEGGDGIVALLLGALLAVIGVCRLAGFELPSGLGKAEVLFIIVIAGIVVLDYIDVSGRTTEFSNEFVAVTVGPGLYVIGVGVLLALWGGFAWGKRDTSSQTAASNSRECPHCKSSIRRDASVCPHCQRESAPWILHEGRWWTKGDDGKDYYLEGAQWKEHQG